MLRTVLVLLLCTQSGLCAHPEIDAHADEGKVQDKEASLSVESDGTFDDNEAKVKPSPMVRKRKGATEIKANGDLIPSKSSRLVRKKRGAESQQSMVTTMTEAPQYVLKSSGTCAPEERVLDAKECMEAAKSLGKKDNDGQISGDPKGLGGRPFGCTWHNFGNVELWGGDKGADCGSFNYNCICKAPTPKYVLKPSGTCAPEERVLDATECMEAAKSLGKIDKDGQISGDPKGLGGRPFGCTWHNFGNVEMWGGDKGADCGSFNYNCICRTPAPLVAIPTIYTTIYTTIIVELEAATAKPPYILKSSGTCAPEERILNAKECMEAAKSLGKIDKDGAISGDPKGLGGRPFGCTWHNFGNVELWGADKGAACGSFSYNCICKESEVPRYVLKSSGTCAPEDRVLDAKECMEAADSLGLKDKDGAISGDPKGLGGRPFGCTWHNFGNVELWGADKGADCGSFSYNCICKES